MGNSTLNVVAKRGYVSQVKSDVEAVCSLRSLASLRMTRSWRVAYLTPIRLMRRRTSLSGTS